MVHLATIFAWATGFASKMHAYAKMTAKWPVDLAVQKMNSSYQCGQINLLDAQGSKCPEVTACWTFVKNAHIKSRQFSVRFYSSVCVLHIIMKLLYSIRLYMMIKKVSSCWSRTCNGDELACFENFPFSRKSRLPWFRILRTHRIWYMYRTRFWAKQLSYTEIQGWICLARGDTGDLCLRCNRLMLSAGPKWV